MPDFRQPTLQNALVLVRPLQQEDFDALFEVAADPLIWEQHPAQIDIKETYSKYFFQRPLSQKAP